MSLLASLKYPLFLFYFFLPKQEPPNSPLTYFGENSMKIFLLISYHAYHNQTAKLV